MKSRDVLIAVAAALVFVACIFAVRHERTTAAAPAAASQSPSPPAAAPATPAIPAVPETGRGRLPVPPPAATPASTIAPISIPPQPATPAPNAAAYQPNAGTPISRAQAMVELEKVHHMIDSYHTLMGQNPVGTNAEIMKALMGGNPHQAMLGPPPGQSLNANGELVDPWGTPYFFHQLSGDDMEIHSAGPDRIMGTADDLVIP